MADTAAGQAAIELYGMHAGDAEDGLDAPGFELLDEEFAAGGHGRSFFMFSGMEKARKVPRLSGLCLVQAALATPVGRRENRLTRTKLSRPTARL